MRKHEALKLIYLGGEEARSVCAQSLGHIPKYPGQIIVRHSLCYTQKVQTLERHNLASKGLTTGERVHALCMPANYRGTWAGDPGSQPTPVGMVFPHFSISVSVCLSLSPGQAHTHKNKLTDTLLRSCFLFGACCCLSGRSQ